MTGNGAYRAFKVGHRAATARNRVGQHLKYWHRRHAGPALTSFKNQLSANLLAFADERQLTVWLLAFALGPAIAYAAIGFRLLIGVFQSAWLFTSEERMIAAAHLTPWWLILLAPTVAGVIVGWVLDTYMPGKRTHAVADVIEAKGLHDCRIDPKTGMLSALLSTFALGFGASAGREGPVVHMAATLNAWLSGKFNLTRSARRTLMAASVAAAISASFNAPIAGVLFAHEVILQHYALRAFVPIVSASVAAGIITRLHFGNDVAFIIPNLPIVSLWEFPAFMILGAVCALVAIIFQLSIRATESVLWKIEMPLWLRSGIGGLCVGLIAVIFPHVIGVGYEATDQALSQNYSVSLLLMLIVAKTAASSITLASRFATGIFSPALYLGAMTGAAFGLIATAQAPDASSSASLYAVLGMGGVAAAVLGAPISTTMIAFELTGGFNVGIALLITVSIATGLSQAGLGQGYFHWQLKKRGLLLHEGPHRAILRRTQVAEFMTPESEDDAPKTLASASEPSLKPSDNLEHALRTFARVGAHVLPVVDPEDGLRIIGHAQRMTAMHAYNQALVEAHIDEHR